MEALPELDPQIRFRAGQASPASRIPWLTRRQIQVGRHIAPPPAGSQSVIVAGNIRYGSKQQRMGRTQLPVSQYLTQGAGYDGKDARLFGPCDPITLPTKSAGDPHQFRMAVSFATDQTPPYFPFQPFGELFMQRVEKDLQRPLDWIAAVHHDTDNPHIHIVIRGRDRQGEPLCILNDYLSHGLRYQAARLATWFLGPAHTRDRQQEHTHTMKPQERGITAARQVDGVER